MITLEEACEYLDLTDINNPIWIKRPSKNSTNIKLGHSAGHILSNGTKSLSICGKQYNYGKLLNFWKYGVYDSDNNAIIKYHGYEDTKKVKSIHTGIVNRVGLTKGYEDVTLHEAWYDFKEWFLWAVEQKGFMCKDFSGNLFEIDKDLFSPLGDRKYSPETCCFVPNTINQLVKMKTTNKCFGVQVFQRKKNPYRAYIHKFGKPTSLGYYLTMEEARDVSLKARLTYIDELKDLYKDSIREDVWSKLKEL